MIFNTVAKEELKYAMGVSVSGVLEAGNNTITLSDPAITTDSQLDFYTSKYGISPKSVNVTDGSMVLTFEIQTEDITVKVVCK